MDWSGGYRVEIGYTHGYYGEMNPAAMRFLLLVAGLAPPDVRQACELGYGQGISINIHAATEAVAWTGTDFNPAQAAFANEMAKISGAHCAEDSFEEFCARSDLPDFDFIALHGIWSWVSPQCHAAFIKFIAKKLRPGGVAYISYNTAPGWSAFQPARDLMAAYAQTLSGSDPRDKAQAGFAFLEKLLAVNPGYAQACPNIAGRIAMFKGKAPAYLVHEFFNKDWSLTNFAAMAERLAEAKLSYACSAQPMLILPTLGLSLEQREFVATIKDAALRETVIDFIRNTQFRKDYWIKGARPMGALARAQALRNERIILTANPQNLQRTVKTAMGDVNISEAAHAIFAATLADGKVHTLGELEKAAPAGSGETLHTLAQACCALLAGGLIAIAQQKVEQKHAASDKLNTFFEYLAMQSADLSFLASPLTGGGVAVPRFEMLYLLAMRRGFKKTDEMAQFVLNCLQQAGQTIVQEDKPLDNDQALAWLRENAAKFAENKLPALKNLLIA